MKNWVPIWSLFQPETQTGLWANCCKHGKVIYQVNFLDHNFFAIKKSLILAPLAIPASNCSSVHGKDCYALKISSFFENWKHPWAVLPPLQDSITCQSQPFPLHSSQCSPKLSSKVTFIHPCTSPSNVLPGHLHIMPHSKPCSTNSDSHENYIG